MLRIHFSDGDLARTRVAAAPDPVWEIAASLHRLQSPKAGGPTSGGTARRGSSCGTRTGAHAALAPSRPGGQLSQADRRPGSAPGRSWTHARPLVLQLGRAGRLRRSATAARALVLAAPRAELAGRPVRLRRVRETLDHPPRSRSRGGAARRRHRRHDRRDGPCRGRLGVLGQPARHRAARREAHHHRPARPGRTAHAHARGGVPAPGRHGRTRLARQLTPRAVSAGCAGGTSRCPGSRACVPGGSPGRPARPGSAARAAGRARPPTPPLAAGVPRGGCRRG